MLVLTRHTNETIIINDQIKVMVLGVSGGVVRLGIEAPRDIDIHREEVYARIQAEKGLDYQPSHSKERVHGHFPDHEGNSSNQKQRR